MNRKIFSKLLAVMLVITLTFANVLLLGNYANKTYATQTNLDNQTITTNDPNVEFDAYYVDTSNKSSHSIKQDINSKDLQLHLYAKVTKGYLKDIKINMFGEEEASSTNFYIQDSAKNLATIESIDTNSNTLKLKQLDKDTQVLIKIPVYANKDDIYDLANFEKQNNIKITAKYVNNEGKEISINKTVKTSIEWNSKVKALVEQEVLSNININSTKSVMLQTVVRTSLENNVLPIQQTNINIKVPIIEGIKPEKVLVIANQTTATNGKEGITFNENNWNYNETTGTLAINTENETIGNKVSWDKQGKDEYVITYIFPELITEKIQSGLKVNQTVSAKITSYGAKTQETSATQELEIDLSTAKGEIISNNISNSIKQLSKGYFYSKIDKNIEYTVKNVLQIPNKDLLDKLVITNKAEELLVGEQIVSLNNSSLYNSTLVNKSIFDAILGEEGFINIYGTDGNLIYTINKDTTIENGNYVYNYEGTINSITMETSKPVKEGNLIIENRKLINCNTNYTTEQIASFNKLKTTSVVKAIYKDQEILNTSKELLIELIEPQTKIEAEINKNNLSTVVTNENVQIKTILKTNDETCMLYENPVIEIELPKYVENIQINSVNLGYNNTLTFDESKLEIIVNQAGNKVIRIPLTGKDTQYNFDNISKGANVIINANLTLAKLTPTTNSNININVYNNNGTKQNASAQIAITAVAPMGMVTTTQLSEYSARNIKAMALNGEEQTLKLDVNSQERNINVQMDIINNNNNICKNIFILGKVPYKVANMVTPIKLNGVDSQNVTIYYTDNENATSELNVTSNKWTKSTENLAQVKAYLIVINNYEMAIGQNISVNYNLLIPANLTYNLESDLTYTVYYDNVKTEQTIKDSTQSAYTKLTTGEGPELEVGIKSNLSTGVKVQEGTEVKYTVSVKNVGKTVVENITLKGSIPENSVHFEYTGAKYTEEGLNKKYNESKKEDSIKIDTLQPNETKTMEYEVEVFAVNSNEEKRELKANGTAVVDGYDTTFKSNEIANEITEGYLKVEMEASPISNEIPRSELFNDEYVIKVTNVNSKEKEDVVVTVELPEELAFEKANNNGEYNNENNTVTWNLGKLNGNEIKTLVLNTMVTVLDDGVFEKTISLNAVAKTAEKEVVSNNLPITIKKENLTIKQSTTTPSEVVEGDTISYDVVLENTGKGDATLVQVVDELPEGLKLKNVQYVYEGKTYDTTVGAKRSVKINLPAVQSGTKVEIHLEAVAEKLNENETNKEVKNIVKVSSELTDEIKSNEITHKIVKVGSGPIKDPSTDGEIVKGTYSISGLAWIDTNKDGKRDADEKLLPNMQVMLINAENGEIVKDINTKQDKIQTTTNQGQYIFTNLKEGKYIVVYLYDTNNYGLTEYQKDGVISTNNSDALEMRVKYQGEERLAGATNAIDITNSNIYNMDIGLITRDKFNLSLNKAITKIVVNNSKGTKTYEYKDTKLAKLDLDSKTLNSTSIIIEYKITVSNIGEVPGYVRKIVDYIPKDMKFSSELNKDWYVADNGDAYNSSLANTVINPGEIKEVTLLLTKNMAENNLGTINNRAEIYEAYNNLGLKDEDSTPGNKVDSENDMSYADAVISLKTGETVVYIGITLTCIIALGVGIYLIKKKVLRRI